MDFQGKVSGFDVLRFGAVSEARLRCFAFISEPGTPPKAKEIQVITEEVPLQLALALGAMLKCPVEVEYNESDGINRLNRVRMLDR
jgi:hypothetical protein